MGKVPGWIENRVFCLTLAGIINIGQVTCGTIFAGYGGVSGITGHLQTDASSRVRVQEL